MKLFMGILIRFTDILDRITLPIVNDILKGVVCIPRVIYLKRRVIGKNLLLFTFGRHGFSFFQDYWMLPKRMFLVQLFSAE
jgi:hypothetical protein